MAREPLGSGPGLWPVAFDMDQGGFFPKGTHGRQHNHLRPRQILAGGGFTIADSVQKSLAAEKAGWGATQESEKGRALGVAVHESFGSYVAMVADVTAQDAAIRVNRIVAAVDVGVPVNPDVIRAYLGEA